MDPNQQPDQLPPEQSPVVPAQENIQPPVAQQAPEVQPAPAPLPDTQEMPVPQEEIGPDDAADQDQPTELPQIEPVQWQAAEYLQHGKQPIWYIGFIVIVIALIAVAVFMKSITFAILIPVMAVALMVYSHRPPRELTYVVSEKGLYINNQLHPMGEFKAFGVMQEGEQHSLSLIPVKRFRPSLVVYFPAEVGERMVDILGAYIPMQEVHPDAFDRIVRKLHI